MSKRRKIMIRAYGIAVIMTLIALVCVVFVLIQKQSYISPDILLITRPATQFEATVIDKKKDQLQIRVPYTNLEETKNVKSITKKEALEFWITVNPSTKIVQDVGDASQYFEFTGEYPASSSPTLDSVVTGQKISITIDKDLRLLENTTKQIAAMEIVLPPRKIIVPGEIVSIDEQSLVLKTFPNNEQVVIQLAGNELLFRSSYSRDTKTTKTSVAELLEKKLISMPVNVFISSTTLEDNRKDSPFAVGIEALSLPITAKEDKKTATAPSGNLLQQ